MTLKNKELIQKSFSELLHIKNESDIIEIETHMLMYQFLGEIEKITTERGISRKELAKLTGTSASYITQLYRGKKTINLQMLARIQRALDFKFKIGITSPGKRAEKTNSFELKAFGNPGLKGEWAKIAALEYFSGEKYHHVNNPLKKGKIVRRAQKSV